MNLTVFGATGGVGQQIVTQALAHGHAVTAFSRRPEKLGLSDPNLRGVAGDVRDPDSVRRAVDGQDAVVCALGMPLMNADGLRAAGTTHIVDAMTQTGVRRLVCLSALGTGNSHGVLPGYYRYLLVPLFMRRLYADHLCQEAHVQNSGLDWIIVRPGSFTNGPHTGTYRHGFTAPDRSLTLKISRADVADFMLRQVDEDTYLRQSPGLSY